MFEGGLQTKEIHDLLKDLTTKEITLKEMETEARHIKEGCKARFYE